MPNIEPSSAQYIVFFFIHISMVPSLPREFSISIRVFALGIAFQVDRPLNRVQRWSRLLSVTTGCLLFTQCYSIWLAFPADSDLQSA